MKVAWSVMVIMTLVCVNAVIARSMTVKDGEPNILMEVYAGAGAWNVNTTEYSNTAAEPEALYSGASGESGMLSDAGNLADDPSYVLLSVKCWLEGAYQEGGSMSTFLEDNDYIPLISPYSDSREVSGIPDGVTDWVYVELRLVPGGAPLEGRSFFIRSDGCVADDDGSTVELTMEGIVSGDYYIVVMHRNHLTVMSSSAQPLNSSTATTYDFSTGTGKYYSGDAAVVESGVYGMTCGDTNGSGIITNADKDPIINDLNAAEYCASDANCSGIVTNSDKDPIINNLNKATGVPVLSSTLVTDIDGNEYHTVVIGDQEWMVENLKVTHYRNGEAIPNVTDGGAWGSLTTGAYCNYENNTDNAAVYGRLYNWYTVTDSRNIAPTGWHVPSDAEWQTLVDYLGGDSVAGGKMKEAGTVHWTSPNEATNESGFTALPGGIRNEYGFFGGLGSDADFWSSEQYLGLPFAWSRSLGYSGSDVARTIHNMLWGLSVRCVREAPQNPAISGTIRTSDGSGIAGITLTFSNSGGSTTTNGSGYYSKTVTNGWSGTVTPSLSGYSFDPASRTYSNVTSDQSDQDYSVTVTDIDGNVYQTVVIGDQVWMAENLKVTHYRNGEAIPNVTDNSSWAALTTGACCDYDNNPDNVDTYGRMYNWYAVTDSRNMAPAGWHVPTDEEWETLTNYLGSAAGSKLAGNAALWTDGLLENDAAFGESGFSALPGGCRYGTSGNFDNLGYDATFWSSTENHAIYAWNRLLNYGNAEVYRYFDYKQNGFSVRCIRDD